MLTIRSAMWLSLTSGKLANVCIGALVHEKVGWPSGDSRLPQMSRAISISGHPSPVKQADAYSRMVAPGKTDKRVTQLSSAQTPEEL